MKFSHLTEMDLEKGSKKFYRRAFSIAFDFIWKVLLSDRNFANLLDLPLQFLLFHYSTYLFKSHSHRLAGAYQLQELVHQRRFVFVVPQFFYLEIEEKKNDKKAQTFVIR